MTKRDTIQDAITALRSRDASEYRDARGAYFAADLAYTLAGKELAAQSRMPYRALETALKRALAPHSVEWKRYGAPSDKGDADVNCIDYTTGAHLSGEVWPQPKGGKYNMHARAHIPFSISPRDANEFRRFVAMIRAAADAMTEGGL